MPLEFPGIKLDEHSLKLRKECDTLDAQLRHIEGAIEYITSQGDPRIELKMARITRDAFAKRIAAIEAQIIVV